MAGRVASAFMNRGRPSEEAGGPGVPVRSEDDRAAGSGWGARARCHGGHGAWRASCFGNPSP